MKKVILLLVVFCFNINASTVRSQSSSLPAAYASNTSSNISLQLITDKATSGDGSTETDPMKVYVPMGGTGAGGAGLEQRNSLVLSPSSLIPLNPGLAAGGGGASYVLIKLNLSNSTGSTQYLKAAVKDDSSVYRTIALETNYSVAANTTASVDSVFNIQNMCAVSNLSCVNIKNAVSATGANYGEFTIYYFLTSTNSGPDSSISPSSETGGVYVKYFFSDRLPTGTVTINRIYNGDSRAFIDFSGGETVSQMGDKIYKTMVYNHASAAGAGGTVGTSGGIDRIKSMVAPTLNGLLDVQNLANNTDYNFSVALVNKFLFHSPMSASKLAHPEPIEALLKKQACFLLTAGFAGNHPVVEYFRYIRDQYLLNFSLGKMFVESYYSWAPKMAPVILNSPILSKFIRAGAYFVYFIIHNFVALLIPVAILVLSLWFARAKKRPKKILGQ